MPHRPAHGCNEPGCPALVRDTARCVDHTRALAREIDSMRGSASQRGYGVRWRRIRAKFLRRNALCVTCLGSGLTVEATDVDHIVSRARGGNDRNGNLQALCHACHSRKTALEDGRFGPSSRRPR